MLNKVIIMGRLTRDPELKYTPANVAVCSFSVAVDRRYVKQGEQRQADFFDIVTWRQQAEFVCKYFAKGRMINVVGSLQTRTWDDANGVRRYVTEVSADEVNFCGDKPGTGQPGGGIPAGGGYPVAPEPNQGANFPQSGGFVSGDGFAPVDTDDDLPF